MYPIGRRLVLLPGLAVLLAAPASPAPTDAGTEAPLIRPEVGPKGGLGFIALDGGKKNLTYQGGDSTTTLVRIDAKDQLFKPAVLTRTPTILLSQTFPSHVSVRLEVRTTRGRRVPAAKSAAPDTCLVTYAIENGDKTPHEVGVATLIDTMIGENDGHPFLVPDKEGMVTTSADLRGAARMPLYVKALERADTAQPGLTAYLTLRVGGDVLPPDRCCLTRLTLPSWDLQIQDISGDAAVVLFWDPVRIPAGERRVFGYGFGLGVAAAAGE